MAQWTKGQSGNPKGRTPKERTLTAELLDALERQLARKGRDGKSHLLANKAVMADLIVQAVTQGEVEFTPDPEHPNTTRRVPVPMDEWIALVKFVYTHIDGPAPAPVGGGDDDLDAVLDYLDSYPAPVALPAPSADR